MTTSADAGLQTRLRYVRAELLDLSQVRFAEAVSEAGADFSISQGSISNYERGATPSAAFFTALHDAFPNVSIEWLLTGAGEPLRDSPRLLESYTGDFDFSLLASLAAVPLSLPPSLQAAAQRIAARLRRAGVWDAAGAVAELLRIPLRKLAADHLLDAQPLGEATERYVSAQLLALDLAADAAARTRSFQRKEDENE